MKTLGLVFNDHFMKEDVSRDAKGLGLCACKKRKLRPSGTLYGVPPT
jgi:hypothetical protein